MSIEEAVRLCHEMDRESLVARIAREGNDPNETSNERWRVFRDGAPQVEYEYLPFVGGPSDVLTAVITSTVPTDFLIRSAEQRLAYVLTNPLTGNSWAAGEMRDVIVNHDGAAKGWAADAVVTYGADVDGNTAVLVSGYRPVEVDGVWTVEWLEDQPPYSTRAGLGSTAKLLSGALARDQKALPPGLREDPVELVNAEVAVSELFGEKLRARRIDPDPRRLSGGTADKVVQIFIATDRESERTQLIQQLGATVRH